MSITPEMMGLNVMVAWKCGLILVGKHNFLLLAGQCSALTNAFCA